MNIEKMVINLLSTTPVYTSFKIVCIYNLYLDIFKVNFYFIYIISYVLSFIKKYKINDHEIKDNW